MLKSIETSYNLKLIGPMCRNVALRARVQLLLLIKLCWGVAEDADVDIQPITRADIVPAKVFRSRSMNTPAGERVCVWCGFVGCLCQVSYAPLHFLILRKCYAVHINATSL